jgi:predicted permease
MALLHDLRYALRMLRSRPLMSGVAVFSLALGIGANTAVFSIADQLILKTLPVRAPQELYSVIGGIPAYPVYREFRDRQQVFSGLAASSWNRQAALRTGSGGAELVSVRLVTGNFFSVVGTRPAIGRLLQDDDDSAPGANPVAVIGHGLWIRMFAANPAILGARVSVNGYPIEIVGVADRRFYGIEAGQNTDVYIPIQMAAQVLPSLRQTWNSPGYRWLWVMGRLSPDVHPKQAQAALNTLAPHVAEGVRAQGHPELGGLAPRLEQVEVIPGAQGVPLVRMRLGRPVLVLLIVTGLVLLIACANVANILLAGAAARRREIAIRLALGASRWRLVRLLLVESAMLAALGGTAGLLLQFWISDGLAGLLAGGPVPFVPQTGPDARVLAFTAAVSVLAALVFGLAPALNAGRRSIVPAMRPDSASEPGRGSAARALVAAQVALSLVLLIVAGLFARTLGSLRGIETGFDRDSVLLFRVDPAEHGYNGHRMRTFYDRLLERARAHQGVVAAALALHTPLQGAIHTMPMRGEGYQPQPDENLSVQINRVSPGFFTTMGIPILAGRDFLPEDEPAVTPAGDVMSVTQHGPAAGSKGARRAAIVSELLARRFFGDENPVGRRMLSLNGDYRIVGVVKDVRWESVRKQPAGMVYIPSWQHGAQGRVLAVRIGGGPKRIAAAVREDVRALDPAVPVLKSMTLNDQVNAMIGNERFMARLSAAFALLAVLLAVAGLYGVLAHGVARRTKEIGIRMALGAGRRGVLRMILRESGTIAVAGIALGLLGAAAATRLIAGLLYGVTPLDPLTYVAAALLLLAVALFAAWVPARRAASVDPTEALRYE